MTVTDMLPARPGVSVRRHAIFAIGSGLTGLTATKALKLAQLNMTDALVCVTRFLAQGLSRFVSQAPQWTPVIPATFTVSVLVALIIAAAVDIAKLVADQPNSRSFSQSGEASGSMTKGLV